MFVWATAPNDQGSGLLGFINEAFADGLSLS